MRKIFKFLIILIKKCKENDIMLIANALTYKILISMFPLIIFIMTLMGFLNIGIDKYILDISKSLPGPIKDILLIFLKEVIQTKRISLLSISFLVSIYSASTGFNSIINGINKAYQQIEEMPFIRRRISSIILVFIFSLLISLSLVLFVFIDYIKYIIIKYTSLEFIPYFLDSLFLYIFIVCVLTIMVLVIYKISISKKVTIPEILPGALITVISWLILSKGFNIYINNFSRYSKIYGSIGGVFVLVIWINMISLILLIGGQINSIFKKNKYNFNDIFK